MGASNWFENNILNLVLRNKQMPNVGTTQGLRTSTSNGVVWVSLHTADPGDSTSQATSEVATSGYGGYERVSVARTTSNWTLSGNNASNTTALSFAQSTSGSTAVSHFGVGGSSSGAGHMYFSGALSSTLNISAGITPQFAAGDLDIYCS
jgi:hypothetical protein